RVSEQTAIFLIMVQRLNSQTCGTLALPGLLAITLFFNFADGRTLAQDDNHQSSAKPPLLQEYKNTHVLYLRRDHSRLFNVNGTVLRTSVSDPQIAEPVVLCQDQLVLIGKRAGHATLVIWAISNLDQKHGKARSVPDKIATVDVHVLERGTDAL